MDPIGRRLDQRPKRPTNVSVSEELLAEAKGLGVDVSRACEQGLANAVRHEKARRWQEANAAGFEAWDAYVERNGVPLGQYRKF